VKLALEMVADEDRRARYDQWMDAVHMQVV
jgi:hypothetical protein